MMTYVFFKDKFKHPSVISHPFETKSMKNTQRSKQFLNLQNVLPLRNLIQKKCLMMLQNKESSVIANALRLIF